MANNYSTFDSLFKGFITGHTGDNHSINIENFNIESLGAFSEHQDVFWSGLLQYLHKESNIDKLNHDFAIREKDFNEEEENHKKTIIEYITNNIDTINNFLDDLYNKEDFSHWNESFQKLVTYYQNNFGVNSYAKEIDSTNITINDIINANAGNSFSDTGSWVTPWVNINQNSYEEVRDKDKIVRVLSSDSHIQFTHKVFEKYIRLLMPEYERTVEIEDLDRNFWVIGQVLTGICSYLFDEDSPVKNLLAGMVDEIAQLWENLLYLWIGFVLISQEYYKEQPIVIVTPVPFDNLTPYVKFDDFFPRKSDLNMSGVQSSLNQIQLLTLCWQYLSYLKDLYPKNSLIVIPEIRYGNYAFNYYCGAIYPGVISLNRNIANERSLEQYFATNANLQNKFVLEYIPFSFKAGENSFYRFRVSPCLGQNNKTVIANHEFTHNLWGIDERSDKYYFINDCRNGASGTHYTAAMRVTFKNCQYSFDINGQLDSLSIECQIRDIAKFLYSSTNDSLILNATFSLGPCYISAGSQETEVDRGLVCDTTQGTVFIDVSSSAPSPEYAEIKKGWYRGEVPSWEIKQT